MSVYRSHVEALRARVEQLEELIRTLGHSDPSAQRRAAHRRRQAIVLAAFALIATLIAGGVLALRAAERPSLIDARTFAAQDPPDGALVRVYARPDLSTYVDWLGHRMIAPHPLYIVADRTDPRVLYVGTVGDDRPLASPLQAGVQPEGVEIIGARRGLTWCAHPALDVTGVEICNYAWRNDIVPDDVRVIDIYRARTAELPRIVPMSSVPLAALVLAASIALVFLFALFFHAWRTRHRAALPTRQDFEPRAAGGSFVLSLLSLHLYALWWGYAMTRQLRRLTARPDLLPGLDLVLTIGSFGIWSIWAAYRNAQAIAEAMHELEQPTTLRPRTVLFFAPLNALFGLGHALTLLRLQRATNALAAAKLARARTENSAGHI